MMEKQLFLTQILDVLYLLNSYNKFTRPTISEVVVNPVNMLYNQLNKRAER